MCRLPWDKRASPAQTPRLYWVTCCPTWFRTNAFSWRFSGGREKTILHMRKWLIFGVFRHDSAFFSILHKCGGKTHIPKKLVRMAGLEPARLAALPPQSSVSANSTTCAKGTHSETTSRAPRKTKVTSGRFHSKRIIDTVTAAPQAKIQIPAKKNSVKKARMPRV